VDPADALAIQRALEVLQRAQATTTPPITVREIHARYEPWYKANHSSYRSAFIPRWNHLLPYFGDRAASAITLADADAYRAARATGAAGSRNCELNSLRAAFGWAVKRKLILTNPLSGMEEEPAANVRTAFLDEAGFDRLSAAAPNPMARALFLMAFDTGMRRGELLALERVSVDLEERIVRLGDHDVKNGTGRMVPLTQRVVDTLRALPAWSKFLFSMDGGAVQRSTLHRWFAIARKKSGTPEAVKFHSLRSSAATLMRRRGVPWPLVKVALGWKTEAMAHRYQQFSAEDWASLRDRMDVGIATDTRKPPIRSIPVNPQSPGTVTNKAQATTEK
jgi:integrase